MFNLSLTANTKVLSTSELTATMGGKRFLGTFASYSWGSPIVQDFLRQGSVSCIGTNQTMKANLYQNSLGDTICVEW